MAKRKHSDRRPQPRHDKKSSRSQHDKRKRLEARNASRSATTGAAVPLRGFVASVAEWMANLLDVRSGFRFPIILAGAMLAKSRRTASSWFKAAGVGDDWDRFYDCLKAVGKQALTLMSPLLVQIMKRFDPGPDGYWCMAIDDSPTKRFGRHVEAANVHHNPTPGPADGPWLYGHNWVCLAMLIGHCSWGVVALPILSALYVRQCDIDGLNEKHDWTFRTKHELAFDLVSRVTGCLRALGSAARFVLVVDGAYAARPLLVPLLEKGVTVVSRLRSDAQLFDLPKRTGKPGRPAKYGKNRVSLKIRAGRRDGWDSVTYNHRGVEATRKVKSFVATSKLVGGPIRVVILQHDNGNWAAYFSTDPDMEVSEILKLVADRWAIEECFHDTKEVWGAGQQQVRNVWSNVGCWHINTWLYTIVELACWDEDMSSLVDRSDRAWDNPSRRPSHNDRRRWIARKMLMEQFSAHLPAGRKGSKLRSQIEGLLNLAV